MSSTTLTNESVPPLFTAYRDQLTQVLAQQDLAPIYELAQDLRRAWGEGKRVFICGNGGSAANAQHLANDLLYGISRKDGRGLRVHALTADSSILTCLANDLSYADVFSAQLKVQASAGDVLVVLSGSGNSKNILKALLMAKEMGMKSTAILGYSGGECLKLADRAIHFPINDMQIAEDVQLVVGHLLMRWLCENPPEGRRA